MAEDTIVPEIWLTRSDRKEGVDAAIQSKYHTNEDLPCDPLCPLW